MTETTAEYIARREAEAAERKRREARYEEIVAEEYAAIKATGIVTSRRGIAGKITVAEAKCRAASRAISRFYAEEGPAA